MEEQWVTDRVKILQARTILKRSMHSMPAGLARKMEIADPDERNGKTEPLVVAVVRYVKEEQEQIAYLRVLESEGANLNSADGKERRTALMYACMGDSDQVAKVLIQMKGINLKLQDRLGNTALMYAVVNGHEDLVNRIALKLTDDFGLGVLTLQNCMGNTAEELAIRNKQHRCARLLQKERIRMVTCMNKQLDSLQSIQCRHWKAYAALYKCVEKWRPRPRRNSLSDKNRKQFRERQQSF